jgi:hypothetical protein
MLLAYIAWRPSQVCAGWKNEEVCPFPTTIGRPTAQIETITAERFHDEFGYRASRPTDTEQLIDALERNPQF